MNPRDHELLRELFHAMADLSPDEREQALRDQDVPNDVVERLHSLFRYDEQPDRLDPLAAENENATATPMGGELERLAALFDDRTRKGLQDTLVTLKHDESGSSLEAKLRQVYGNGSPPAEADEATSSTKRYELREKVAEGGMGTILKVWDPSLRRHVAMKVTLANVARTPKASPTPSPSDSYIRRFVDEAQITGQLDHPGVVPVHELSSNDEGDIYFTMRLVKGLTYRDVIKKVSAGEDGWTLARALQTLLRVCETMAFAHSRDVIHRDIKPANIMVGSFGETYVMDWGLAKVHGEPDQRDLRPKPQTEGLSSIQTDRDAETSDGDSPLYTMDGDVIGTPSYMPPEQAAGERDRIGPQADVYAVGAVLYHLLASHPPYVQPGMRVDAHTILARVLDGPPARLADSKEGLPEELVAICDKAMSRKIDNRYPDMGAMADDVRAYLEQRVVRAYRTGAVPELKKWIARNRPLAAALAAALFFIVAGLSSTTFVTRTKNQALAQRNKELDIERARANGERDKAERRADEIQDLNQTLAQRNEELDSERRRANDERDRAQDRAAEVLRLSDLRNLTRLEERARELWPAHPHLIGELETWCDDAEELSTNKDLHLESIARLETTIAEEEAEPDDSSLQTLNELRWWLETERRLVADIDAFLKPDSGTLSNVRQRLDTASRIEGETIDAFADEWEFAIDEIYETYNELEIEETLGLIPLGPDPESELWEFYVWDTGEPPERDEESGRLIITGQTAMVMVLLPGGRFSMGSSQQPGSPNFSPIVIDNEMPAHEIELQPFFISKYELTIGQWVRVVDNNLDILVPLGADPLSHPVNNISWDMATQKILKRLAFDLPTEAQWEYACRAGSSEPWTMGANPADIRRFANTADEAFALHNQSGVPVEP